MTLRPGKRSSVPSKIRCESAIVVSSGLPMVLPSQPLPDCRLPSSGTPCGWMNSGTPSSSALAHKIGEFDAGDDTADGGALQPLLLHRGLELLHREVGR